MNITKQGLQQYNNLPRIVPDVVKFRKYLIHRRYSENTIRIYSEVVRHFLLGINKATNNITRQDLIDYNHRLIKKAYSASYQNQVASGLKLFFSCVHNRNIEISKIERPRREHKLPNVLSKEEVNY